MQFLRRAAVRPARLGVLPGTFNPVTVAHVALAEAALRLLDEVVFVLPRSLPHKEYTGATFDNRLSLLERALRPHPASSLAVSEGGLFIEIARECRAAYGPGVKLSFLCGRDAAERIVGWDYGAEPFDAQLDEFDLLVADRAGEYPIPEHLRARVARLEVPPEVTLLSATEVRERIARGEPWEHLVPPEARALAREIYA